MVIKPRVPAVSCDFGWMKATVAVTNRVGVTTSFGPERRTAKHPE